MLSASNFKLRATQEITELRDEVIALATDRDIYWKVQREVIQKNARLLTMHSAFFDMMNDSYAHATASRVRRLLDRDQRTVSLRRLLDNIARYPDILTGEPTLRELKADLVALDTTCKEVKDYVDQFVAHHDRNSTAIVPTHRQLNEAVDTIIAKFRRYYAFLTDADIDVVVGYLQGSLAIFEFPWVDKASIDQHASI
jgi:hypothetical protein